MPPVAESFQSKKQSSGRTFTIAPSKTPHTARSVTYTEATNQSIDFNGTKLYLKVNGTNYFFTHIFMARLYPPELITNDGIPDRFDELVQQGQANNVAAQQAAGTQQVTSVYTAIVIALVLAIVIGVIATIFMKRPK